jgi:hypothetical protein
MAALTISDLPDTLLFIFSQRKDSNIWIQIIYVTIWQMDGIGGGGGRN